MKGRLLALAAAAFVLLAGGSAAFLAGGSRAAAVPTTVVRSERFSLAIEAEGFLVPVRRVPVTVPAGVQPPARLAWAAADGSEVEAGQVVLRLDPTDLERGRDEAGAELAKTELETRAWEVERGSSLAGLDRDAEQARLEAEMARRFPAKDPELFSRREILESELDTALAERRVAHADAARASGDERSRLDGDLLALKRREHELRLARAESGLAAIEIRAPFDGLFVLERNFRGEVPKVGDSIWPRQKIAEIPDLREMAAEVFALEADAGALAPGQRARVTVEAHPERPFPARVARVGTLAQRRLRSSPVQYFAVDLAFEATDPALMRPGQRVRAMLELAAVEGALVVPSQALFEREGATVAFRRGERGFEPVAVEVGPAGGGRAVVRRGLAEGDVVALADPEEWERGGGRGGRSGGGEEPAGPLPGEGAGGGEPRR